MAAGAAYREDAPVAPAAADTLGVQLRARPLARTPNGGSAPLSLERGPGAQLPGARCAGDGESESGGIVQWWWVWRPRGEREGGGGARRLSGGGPWPSAAGAGAPGRAIAEGHFGGRGAQLAAAVA